MPSLHRERCRNQHSALNGILRHQGSSYPQNGLHDHANLFRCCAGYGLSVPVRLQRNDDYMACADVPDDESSVVLRVQRCAFHDDLCVHVESCSVPPQCHSRNRLQHRRGCPQSRSESLPCTVQRSHAHTAADAVLADCYDVHHWALRDVCTDTLGL